MNWLINKKTVAVHSGNFHADEIFSVAALSLYLQEKLKIIRTRDGEIISKADYVIDVGQEYAPEKKRFDHHQVGGAGQRASGIPYASFGLVWKEFGEKICNSKELSDALDKKLVAVIDADDNALEICSSYLYDIKPYTVSDYILYKNSLAGDTDRGRVFEGLVSFAKDILSMEIKITGRYLEDRKKVETTYLFSADKKIIVLDDDYDGIDILSEHPEPIFAVRPAPGIKAWKIYCVKEKGEKFKNRLDLPASWGGKRDNELAEITGVADAIYCHHQRYMAITKSKEGAIKLAQIALEK